MRTLTEKYRAVQEGRFAKAQFLRDARLDQPQLITQHNSYDDAVKILKNRGLLFEAEAVPVYQPAVVQPEDQFSIDAVERGIDVEIEKMGVLAPMLPDEEEYNKAKATTLKNLLKNPNFYIDRLAGVKSTVNKKDALKPVQGNKPVDKDNGMVKVQLKETVNLKDVYKLIDYHERTGLLPAGMSEEEYNRITAKYKGSTHARADKDVPFRGMTEVRQVQIKEAVKKLIYKALNTTPVLLKEEQEDVFSAGFDPKLAFALHKAIIRTLRETGNTFEQEWPLTTAFGYFVNNVMRGDVKENINYSEDDTVARAKETIENLLDPETLANPELMNQFLESLKNELITDRNLFDNPENDLAEGNNSPVRKRITSEGNIR